MVVLSDLLVDTDGSNFAYTMQMIQNVISQENVPIDSDDSGVDLVVLMGSTVNPDFQDQYQGLFEQAVTYLKMMSIPWVSTGALFRPTSAYTRSQLLAFDQASGDATFNGEAWSLSLSGRYNTDPNLGIYTQRIPVYNLAATRQLLNLWIMDSQGGYSCNGNYNGKSCVNASAVSWFQQQAAVNATTSLNQDLMFTTNPLQEFMTLSNNCGFKGNQNQPVCCEASNSGLFNAAQQAGNVEWIVSGSDASNDFSGLYNTINLAMARKSGFSGNTGNLPKGARVVRVNTRSEAIWTTSWVRDFNGNVYKQNTQAEACNRTFDPTTNPNATAPPPVFQPQTQCCSTYNQIADTNAAANRNLTAGQIVIQ